MTSDRAPGHPAENLSDATSEEYPPSTEEVSRRLAPFVRNLDPGAMWPGLSEGARVAAAHEIERITRAVLAGRIGEQIDPGGAHGLYALAIAGHTTGIGPLLGHWIETGIVTAAAAISARFTSYLDHSRRRAARMEREVGPALDALAAAGIQPAVIKGFHTARAYFAEPGLRRMADVDVLVPPERVRDAEAALRSAGFRPDSDALHPYKREWIGVDVDPRVFSLEWPDERSRWILELHASLDRIIHPGTVAQLDAERDCMEAKMIAGRSLLVLRQPLLLLALACHCSQELNGSRLLRLFEMVKVIRMDSAAGRFDWEEFLAMLRRTQAARFAYPALSLVEQLAPGTVDPRVLALCRQQSTWAARHTVQRLVPAGGALDTRGLLRQIMFTRGPVAAIQCVLWILWPAAFTTTRGVGTTWRARLRRLRTGMQALRAPNEREGEFIPGQPPSSASPRVPRATRQS